MYQGSEGAMKVIVALTTTAAALPASEYVVPMWGASISAFGLAAIGSVMSYAWGKPEGTRALLFFKSLSVTLFSVALVVVGPDLFGWELKPESQPPLAFIIATFGRWLIPAMKRAVPAMAQGLATMFSKSVNSWDEPGQYREDARYDAQNPYESSDPRRRKSNQPTNEDNPDGGY